MSGKTLDSLLAKTLIGKDDRFDLDAHASSIITIGDLGDINVRTVNLSFNLLTDLDGIEQLSQLKSLSAYGCKIQYFYKLPMKLEILHLHQNEINELPKSLINLGKLKELRLDKNKLTRLTNLNGLTNLITLDISGNQISSLHGVNSLHSLEELRASHNNITTLRDLSSSTSGGGGGGVSSCRLPRLKELYVAFNQLTSLDGLIGLTTLETLHAENNMISRLFDSNKTDLTRLSFSSENTSTNKPSDDNHTESPTTSTLSSNKKKGKQLVLAVNSHDSKTSSRRGSSGSAAASLKSRKEDKSVAVATQALALSKTLPALTDLYLASNRLDTLSELPRISQGIEVIDVRSNLLADIDELIQTFTCFPNLIEARIIGNPIFSMENSSSISDNSFTSLGISEDVHHRQQQYVNVVGNVVNSLVKKCSQLRMVDDYAIVNGVHQFMDLTPDGYSTLSQPQLPPPAKMTFRTWEDPPGEKRAEEGKREAAEGDKTEEDEEEKSRKRQADYVLAPIMTEEEILQMEGGFRNLLNCSKDALLQTLRFIDNDRSNIEGEQGAEGTVSESQRLVFEELRKKPLRKRNQDEQPRHEEEKPLKDNGERNERGSRRQELRTGSTDRETDESMIIGVSGSIPMESVRMSGGVPYGQRMIDIDCDDIEAMALAPPTIPSSQYDKRGDVVEGRIVHSSSSHDVSKSRIRAHIQSIKSRPDTQSRPTGQNDVEDDGDSHSDIHNKIFPPRRPLTSESTISDGFELENGVVMNQNNVLRSHHTSGIAKVSKMKVHPKTDAASQSKGKISDSQESTGFSPRSKRLSEVKLVGTERVNSPNKEKKSPSKNFVKKKPSGLASRLQLAVRSSSQDKIDLRDESRGSDAGSDNSDIEESDGEMSDEESLPRQGGVTMSDLMDDDVSGSSLPEGVNSQDIPLISPRYIPVTTAEFVTAPTKIIHKNMRPKFRIPDSAKLVLANDETILKLSSALATCSTPGLLTSRSGSSQASFR